MDGSDHVPSQRAPTPRPFSHFAQSVGALDHSPTMVHILDEENFLRLGMRLHAYCYVINYRIRNSGYEKLAHVDMVVE
jgi:hypothetical protein